MSSLESDCVWGPILGATAHASRSAVVPAESVAAMERPDSPSSRGAPAAGGGQLPRHWFREHFDTLWRLALRLGVPQHSVDDVVQEAFIISSRRRADIAEGQERRFLLSTVVRVCSNYRQRASVRHELAQPDLLDQRASSLPDAEQLLIEKRARQELEATLAALSDAHRSVFVLYELEGFSVREIAEILGLPSGTVASRLGRARAQFSRDVERLQRAQAQLPEVP